MVNVRLRTGEQRSTMPVEEFRAYAQGVAATKALI
jgi:hypothetical protein